MTSTAQAMVSTKSSGNTGMKSGATKFMAFPYSLFLLRDGEDLTAWSR